jgi:hypothetical protein
VGLTPVSLKSSVVPPPKGYEVAPCTAESFATYLAGTVADPDDPALGTILRKGLYAAQLATYIDLFGPSQVLDVCVT